MEAWQAVSMVLVAVLVGALLPVAVQLSLALRAVRATAARGEQALVAVAAAATRLERLAARLEDGGRIERLLDAADALSRLAGQVQDGARVASAIGAAVGPAVGAAVRAWRASSPGIGAEPSGANGAGVDPK